MFNRDQMRLKRCLRTLAIRMSVGADGGKHYVVDEEIRGRLQEKLMKAVMQFDINRE